MTSQQQLQRKQATRYKALRQLYEETKGSPWAIAPFFDVAQRAGLDKDAAQDAHAYLTGEGLLKPMTFGGGVSITHQGVKEVESSIADPDRSTPHFSSVVINIKGDVGGVQTGNHNVMTATQTASGTANELIGLIDELKPVIEGLSLAQRQEADELTTAMKDEATAKPPRRVRLRAFAETLQKLLLPVGGEILSRIIDKIAQL